MVTAPDSGSSGLGSISVGGRGQPIHRRGQSCDGFESHPGQSALQTEIYPRCDSGQARGKQKQTWSFRDKLLSNQSLGSQRMQNQFFFTCTVVLPVEQYQTRWGRKTANRDPCQVSIGSCWRAKIRTRAKINQKRYVDKRHHYCLLLNGTSGSSEIKLTRGGAEGAGRDIQERLDSLTFEIKDCPH